MHTLPTSITNAFTIRRHLKTNYCTLNKLSVL